jgi:hypothetical protein
MRIDRLLWDVTFMTGVQMYIKLYLHEPEVKCTCSYILFWVFYPFIYIFLEGCWWG